MDNENKNLSYQHVTMIPNMKFVSVTYSCKFIFISDCH